IPRVPVPRALAFSPDGKMLAGRFECTRLAKVWDATTGRELFSVQEPGGFAVLAFSPDGRRLATLGPGRPDLARLTIWSTSTGQPLLTLGTSPADLLTFSRDGRRLLSANQNGLTLTWDGSPAPRKVGLAPAHPEALLNLA